MTVRAVAALAGKAKALRELHRPGEPLVLPNVWDAAGAKAVADAGFPVVATGSAAVAESLGYGDHEQAPPVEMFAAARRIADGVSLPVTVDTEAGYGMPADELVDALLTAGAVGCNIEDTVHGGGTLADVSTLAAKVAGLRTAASTAGVDLVLNARTDVYMHGLPAGEDRAEEAIRRCRAYVEAGADCVYPILADDPDDIARIVAGVPAPVNVLARPQAPSPRELAGLGVARISYGPVLYRLVQQYLAGVLDQVARAERPA